MSYAITINGNNYALTSTSQDVNLTLSRTGGQGAKGDSITNASIDSNGDFHVIISNSAGQQVQDVNLGGANLIASITALKVATETAADTVDDVFLGSKSSAPSLDNDGNALQNGAMYFDTTTSALGVYNVNTWQYPIALATTSATAAANSATAAATSATAAATSATAANTSKVAAETAETNAETAETNAATSATNASASASTATTKAANAATSETNAATSETNAGNSATAAAASATSASSSDTSATASKTAAATSETNSANSAASAGSSATAAANSATTAGNHSSNAAANAISAASSATSATASAASALNYKTDTATDRAAVELLFDNFDDKFLGTKASDPTLDNDGNALVEGAMYYNSTNNAIKFYNGTAWESPEAAASNSATAAATSATSAATSAASSLTSANNSAGSASTASTLANNAATSATAASNSATAAATSATSAATSATNSATSETNAGNSATAAASSASSASTSATNSATSATNAGNSATAAATSATNAATSASGASTSATNAATSASGASTSATNAATSATAAQTAQAATELAFDNFDDKFLGTKSSDPSVDNDGNALVEGAMYYNSTDNVIKFYSGSAWQAPSVTATNAATSATTSATSASTSATNAGNSATAAATSATNASNSATAANTSKVAAETAKTAAETAETNAETAETNAASSATAAASSATGAASSATSAQTAQTAAEAALDSFDDRYLGSKSSDPSVDNDGNALITGALYFNSTDSSLKVYDGSNWGATAATTEAIQDVVGGLLTAGTGITLNYNDAGNSLTISGSAQYANSNVDSHLNTSTASSGEYLSWNGSDYDWASVPAGYANSDVDTHLNQSSAGNNQILAWNGSDYAWVDDSDTVYSAATTSAAGLMSAADKTKINGIEASATADQTAAEIRTLVESATDSNVFTDSDHTKLNNIEASADVTDTTNVTAAGALMDSEVTNLSQVKAFDSSDYATAAQGTTANAALPKAGGTMTGNLILNANPSVNLGAATKQYVDTSVSSLVDSAPSTLDTLNELAAALNDDANFSTTVTDSIATKLPLAGGTMTGNLSISTGSSSLPAINLSHSNANADNFQITAGTPGVANSGFTIRDVDASANRLVIDSSGNLLVGKTSADTYNNTNGIELQASGLLTATRTGIAQILNREDSDGDIAVFRKDGTTVGSIGTDSNGDFVIDGSANHSGLRFKDNTIVPKQNGSDADNAIDLGKSDKRWKDLHLSGTANVGGIVKSTANTVTASTSATTIDMTASNFHVVTMQADTTFTLSNLANAVTSSGTIVLKQDSTGGRDFTLPSSCKTPVGGATITQYTGANSTSVLSYMVVSSTEVLVNYIGNFA